jgi:surface antigen
MVKVKESPIKRVMLSPCVHPVSLESVPSRKQSTLATHMPHTAIKRDVALREGSYRIRPSDADLNVPYTSQRCIPGNTSQTDQNVGTAQKMSIAVNAPVVPVVPDVSGVSAQQARPAIHFVSQKSTEPFKPSLPIFHGSLDLAEPLSASMLQGSAGNAFPYGQCTWWANQRYYQLHGSFVPWRTNANAFQWVARAIESGWHVSGIPIVGAIMVLQPAVDGAYGLGHVGVVEQILPDGRVMASSMNWGNQPSMVTQATYVLGPGVSFINAPSV